MKPKVLFLCTGNSCRSQMAEGWARHRLAEHLEAYSAGVETHGLNPKAVRVMEEAGVDIRGQRSQHVDELADLEPDLVVTVCDHAAERCPVFPGARAMLHHSFRDPAKAEGSEEEVLEVFREVRDEIREFVDSLPRRLGLEIPEKWIPSGPESVEDFGIFRVRQYAARSPRTGRDRTFTVVDTYDWVNVVALTPADEVVLVRQYRHGTRDVELEIPGGMIDPGEDPAAAAVRELREETGFAGGEPEALGVVDPNPAIQSNRCFTFLIRDCVPVGELRMDPGEDIRVTTLPRSEVRAAVARGEITHSLVICGFWWLRERLGG